MAVPDLNSLPTPAIIEEINTEAIIAEMMADAIALFTARGISYDVGNLEIDPVKIVIEAAAARETKLRQRINNAALANLLAKAVGVDLDHLAAFYDVTRLPAETDDRLRARLVLAIQGRSTAGPEERYQFLAMSASIRVKEVSVYRIDGGPEIQAAILSTDNGGVPDQPLLDAVDGAINNRAARVLSDVVSVVAAVQQTANIIADVWLLPDTPFAVFEGLEDGLRAAWDIEAGIGFDLDPSWVTAKLMAGGVKRAELTAPSVPLIASDNSAIALGTIDLTYAGRLR